MINLKILVVILFVIVILQSIGLADLTIKIEKRIEKHMSHLEDEEDDLK